MSDSLLDLILPSEDARGRVNGVVVGIVTNNEDRAGMGRVRVRFPWLSDSTESHWARVAVPMAGPDRGTYFLPEVDDEVLVAFEHGNIRYPYVVGALWNGEHQPPTTNEDGENNIRLIKSRSGHVIRLDDTDGAEKIEIIDNADNSIIINTADNTITISAGTDITITAQDGKLTLSGNEVEIAAQSGLKVEAGSDADLEAGGNMNIKGSMVNIN